MDRIKAHRSAPTVYDPPTFDQMADRIEQLEDKLAKAVEALRFTDSDANHGAMTSTYSEGTLRYLLRQIRDRTRTVLAELEKQ
jgi:hypothetical protein